MSFRAPNVFVLIFGILLLVTALTWVVPAGRYDRAPLPSGREAVVPGTYHELEGGSREITPWRLLVGDAAAAGHAADASAASGEGEGAETSGGEPPSAEIESAGGEGSAGHRQGIWQALRAPIRALGQGHAAEVAGFILLIGGAFGVLQATGALVAGLFWLSRALGERRLLAIPLLMFAFSVGGATFGMAEETIAFVLVTVPLAISLRFDTITGVAIPFVGSQIGFATAWLNPFTLAIAKGIAGLEVGSEYYRLFCWFVATLLGTAIVTWHAWRVWQDPSRSPTPEIDAMWRQRLQRGSSANERAPAAGTETEPRMDLRRGLVLLVFALTIAGIAYGGAAAGWYIEELSGVFLAMGIVGGLVGGMSVGNIADNFVAGAKDLAGVALLVAFASAITVIANDGMIIDTVLHAVAQSLEGVHETIAVWLMFLIQSAINFFVPSGSGQALLTMPLMAPLSDVLGVSRENAVLAYQFGDGLTNIVIPTNPVLIGCIAAAKIEFGTWFRWVLKVEFALFALAFVLLAFAPF
jgi:uncharacterized ion transporter superfamily protein YfcC